MEAIEPSMPRSRGGWILASAVMPFLIAGGCRCDPHDDPPDASIRDASFARFDAGGPDTGATAPDAAAPGADASALPDAGPEGPDAEAQQDAAEPVDATVAPADAGGSDAGVGLPAAQFCPTYVAAQCDWYLRCGKLDAAQLADCRASLSWTCNQAQVSALAAGKVGYDPISAAACTSGIAARACSQPFPAIAACDATFPPATPIGGTCTRQWSTVCVDSYCKSNACPGTCTAFTAVGEVCSGTEGDECGPNATCAYTSPRRCVAIIEAGGTCAPNDPCRSGTCDATQLKCLTFGSQPQGAACALDEVCATGLYCKSGQCQPSEGAGGPCRVWGGRDCAAGLTCRVPGDAGFNGQCAPSSDEGGPCYGLPADCRSGLLCSSPSLLAPGTCLAAESEGVACNLTAQNCKVALLCNPTTQLCTRLPWVGTACVRDPLNYQSSDCADGFCPAADAGTATCAAPQAAGAACSRPWECASSVCDQGFCAALCAP